MRLQNEGTGEAISTFYVRVRKCSCFAALHVWDAPGQKERRNTIVQSVLDQLRGKPVEVNTSGAPDGGASDSDGAGTRPSVVVTSRGNESARKGSSRCPSCYLNFAWGFWNDSDGGAHVAIGMGWGSTRLEAQNNAMSACNDKGYNCEVTESDGAANGGCGYLSLGNNADGVRAATASTRSRAVELCRRGGYDCDAPVGGCTGKSAG